MCPVHCSIVFGVDSFQSHCGDYQRWRWSARATTALVTISIIIHRGRFALDQPWISSIKFVAHSCSRCHTSPPPPPPLDILAEIHSLSLPLPLCILFISLRPDFCFHSLTTRNDLQEKKEKIKSEQWVDVSQLEVSELEVS